MWPLHLGVPSTFTVCAKYRWYILLPVSKRFDSSGGAALSTQVVLSGEKKSQCVQAAGR